MPDDASSDTLQDRWESIVFPEWRRTNPNIAGLMQDAIEYAAQLEDERDEARAERDRLHDALRDQAICGDPSVAAICEVCENMLAPVSSMPFEEEPKEHADNCPLQEVEQGDTVDRIRREAFEEAADHLENLRVRSHDGYRPDAGQWREWAAEKVRALAEGDDQEDDDE